MGDIIGYNIRLECKQSIQTQILFVTPGVLLRKLLLDPNLDEYSHIIVDEAHERDRFTEFLLILLRDLTTRRCQLKLVLMSATMHTDKLRSYFGDIPQINIGGSVYPVQEFYLEHVLKFTNYLQAKAGNGVGAAAKCVGGTYYCCACGRGPFLSPEELGTHAALCFSSDQGMTTQQPPRRQHHGDKLREVEDKVEHIRNTAKPHPLFTVAANLPHMKTPVAMGEELDEQEEMEFEISSDDNDEGIIADAQEGSRYEQPGTGFPAATTLLSEESTEHHALLASYHDYQRLQHQEAKQVDYDLIISLLDYIYQSEFGSTTESGTAPAVLIFLPGGEDIATLYRILTNHAVYHNAADYTILQLHSGIPNYDQQRVFAPCSNRKVVLSTNIAETSLTIDNVSIVIDTGLAKEKVYDVHTKLSFLTCSHISQASGRQRKGRAGRTCTGVCFRLYSMLRAKHFVPYQASELLRLPLEEIILQAKSLGVAACHAREEGRGGINAFLSKAMDPPSSLAIAHGVALLQSLGCIDEQEGLTPVGEVVAHLPMNPRLGKMLLLGCVVGCAPALLAIASILSYRDPFLITGNELPSKLSLSQASRADFMAAWQGWQGFDLTQTRFSTAHARRYCDEYSLSYPILQQLRGLVQELDRNLRDVGIASHSARSNAHNGRVALITSIATAGMYPCLSLRSQGNKLFRTEKGAKARVHGSSVNAKLHKSACAGAPQLLCYQELTEISPHARGYQIGGANYTMRNTAPMSMLMLLLTCGSATTEEVQPPPGGAGGAGGAGGGEEGGGVVTLRVDHWVRLQLKKAEYALLQQWRSFLRLAVAVFVQQLAPSAGGRRGGGGGVLNSARVMRAVDKLVQALEIEQHLAGDFGQGLLLQPPAQRGQGRGRGQGRHQERGQGPGQG